MSLQPPKILAIEEIAKSRFFSVQRIDLEFSNGAQRVYERVTPSVHDHRAVLIIPKLDNDHILLVREYAVGVEDYTLAFPKGGVDDGEALFAAANRELMEECCYQASHFRHVKRLYLSPSYLSHHIDVVIAEGLTPQQCIGDEPEPIEVEVWHLKDIDQLLLREDFIECRSMASLLYICKEWYLSK